MLVEFILQCSVLLLPHPPIWWFLPIYIFFQNHPPCPKYTQGKHKNNLIRERFFFLFWWLQNNITFLFYKQPQAEIWFKTITANYDHTIEANISANNQVSQIPYKSNRHFYNLSSIAFEESHKPKCPYIVWRKQLNLSTGYFLSEVLCIMSFP